MYSVGQRGTFLFKTAGEEFPIDAHIIAINGAKIEIEFVQPTTKWLERKGLESNRKQRRWLRSRQERARFLTDITVEIKRGAPTGNKNAVLAQKTIRVYVPLAPERATHLKQHLGGMPAEKEIEQAVRTSVYEWIDGLP